MTWFIIRFHPGAPLGVPAVATGPWGDRDLGYRETANWRAAPEVIEVVEQTECPDLPADCLWTHTPAYESAIALSVKRSAPPPPPPPPPPPAPAPPLDPDPALFSVRVTSEQRDLIRSAAAHANLGTGPWARRVLLAAARAELSGEPSPPPPKSVQRHPAPAPPPPPPPPAAEPPLSERAVRVLDSLASPPLTEANVEATLEEMLRDGLVQVVNEPGQPPRWVLTEAGQAMEELHKAGLVELRRPIEAVEAPPVTPPSPPPPVDVLAGVDFVLIADAPAPTLEDVDFVLAAPPASRHKKGARMRPSAYGLRTLKARSFTPLLRGALVGYSRDWRYVRIKRDDIQSVQSYHYSFWELDVPADPAPLSEPPAPQPPPVVAAPAVLPPALAPVDEPPSLPAAGCVRRAKPSPPPVSPVTRSFDPPPIRIRRLPDPGAPAPAEPTAETIFTF